MVWLESVLMDLPFVSIDVLKAHAQLSYINSQYHLTAADGSSDCRLPIFDFRFGVIEKDSIKNRQSEIKNSRDPSATARWY